MQWQDVGIYIYCVTLHKKKCVLQTTRQPLSVVENCVEKPCGALLSQMSDVHHNHHMLQSEESSLRAMCCCP